MTERRMTAPVTVDLRKWIGVPEVIAAFRALADESRAYPGKAIYAADIERTIAQLQQTALVEAADDLGADWRLITPEQDDLFGGAA